MRDDAGIKGRFHDLRHTAYIKMVEAGVAEGIIMALMGHVSRAMVERYGTHMCEWNSKWWARQDSNL